MFQGTTAVGQNALITCTTGTLNTAVGSGAGYTLTTGVDNAIFGFNTGDHITTGSNNTIIGKGAGDNITTGSNNIIIGEHIDPPSATANSQLNIGGWITKDSGTHPDGIGIGISGSGGFQVFQVNAGNMTLADDAVYTMTGLLNTGAMVAVGSRHQGNSSVTYAHGLFMLSYAQNTSVMLADSNSTFANSDTDGKVCVYSSATNSNAYVKNRLGLQTWVSIVANRFTGN